MKRFNVQLLVLCCVLVSMVVVLAYYPNVSMAQAPVITVTRVKVSETLPGLYSFTLKCQIEDGGVEVFNRNYSTDYSLGQGQDPQANVQSLLATIQSDIDRYQAEQGYFNHAKFIAAVGYLETNLTY